MFLLEFLQKFQPGFFSGFLQKFFFVIRKFVSRFFQKFLQKFNVSFLIWNENRLSLVWISGVLEEIPGQCFTGSNMRIKRRSTEYSFWRHKKVVFGRPSWKSSWIQPNYPPQFTSFTLSACPEDFLGIPSEISRSSFWIQMFLLWNFLGMFLGSFYENSSKFFFSKIQTEISLEISREVSSVVSLEHFTKVASKGLIGFQQEFLLEFFEELLHPAFISPFWDSCRCS